jgi:hypothetical protein
MYTGTEEKHDNTETVLVFVSKSVTNYISDIFQREYESDKNCVCIVKVSLN